MQKYPIGTKLIDKDGKVITTYSYGWAVTGGAELFYTEFDKKRGRTLKFPTKAIIQ